MLQSTDALERREDVEVIVVHRAGDGGTRQVARDYNVRAVVVQRPGLARAMRAGAVEARSPVVAFTDDDAELHPDWARRTLQQFDDPSVGAVTGVDLQPDGYPVRTPQHQIGTIDRWGRVIGGHHIAEGSVRDVDHVKGVNCAFRRELFLQADYQEYLAGDGAQARNEFVLSALALRRGARIVLDPAIRVNHFPEPRQRGDERQTSTKAYETAFNESFGFWASQHPRRWRNFAFLLMAGYQNTPGLVRLVRREARFRQVFATVRGAYSGRSAARSWRRAHHAAR
jgi:glycosyltransferase involved in cell wall biosynthesis